MSKSIILGLAAMLVMASCQHNKTVTLIGEIQNYDKTPLLLMDGKISSTPDTIPVQDGRFAVTLHIDNPCIRYLLFGNNRKNLFLFPGKSLKVTFDAAKMDSSFQYEGSLATENTLFDSVTKRSYKVNYHFIYTQPVTIVSKYLDSTFAANKKYFQKLVSHKKTVPDFAEYTEASLDYYCAALKMVLGLQKEVKDSAYYSFIDNLAVENDKCLDLPDYRLFLDYYITLKASRAYDKLDSIEKQSPDANFDEELHVMENLKNIKVKEYCIFNAIYRRLDYNGVKNFDTYYNYFRKNNTDSVYARQISKLYAKKLLLAPGKPAPEFICVDLDSKEVSLSDFKGHYVYIDFWATWCGPCRQELPKYIQLQSDYKGKNIVFVSISLDDNKNSWKNVVKENRKEGISLFAGSSDVAKAYQITGIPTFVLIDKEGKIMDSQAPRPSSTVIYKTLDDILKAE